MKTLHVYCAYRVKDDVTSKYELPETMTKASDQLLNDQNDEQYGEISHQAVWLWTILKESCD